ncbi:MAG: homoaconitate hydratase [Candidatus Altiarchaeales archaeon ex4484_43]|nr:MAG: homoaconitate hydratase [Candidatus Altiarchaeales archaeon ex4484_43]
MFKNKPKCLICDTTLRDGEQMPGVVFSPEEKIELAIKSSEFGTDIMEVMPAISISERILTKRLSDMGLNFEITASTMLKKEHIEIALDCDVQSITLFTPLSDLHLKYKLGVSREENLNRVLDMVDFSKEHGLKVCFAGEDSTRADINYVIEFANELSGKIEYFMPCDTLGCLTPSATYSFIKKLKENCRTPLCLHVHNDFGLATANTLAGLSAGAEMFSGTFCGIGERAGNAPIEEVCTALKFLDGIELDVNYSMLTEICNLVERYSGVKLQSHKPIVGENAFSHESGIHADGIIKHPRTYENFDPEFVGQTRRFLFGKHTGKNVLRYILKKYGIPHSNLDHLLEEIKSISEQQHCSLTETDVLDLLAYEEYSIERGIPAINENYKSPIPLRAKAGV